MAQVMISLLGGRPLPNLLAVLHLKPDCLYIIASEDSFGAGGNCEKFVHALPKHLQQCQTVPVKPYLLTDTIEQCKKISDQHPNDSIIIVSASEPKTMGFGAYDAAKDLRANSRKVDMCYLSREGLIWVFSRTQNIERVKIGLKDYFASYGWDVTIRANQVETRFRDLVDVLVDNLPISHRLLCTLRSNDQRRGRRTGRYNRHMNDDEFSLLQRIQQLEIVSNVQRTDTETRWTINSEEDAKFLLTGDWLEFYVYHTASQLTKPRGELFDECGWGVEDQSGRGEIDFVGIFGGQMIIASCKTEDNIRRAWFEELHSKMEQLGKGMCSALLVSSVSKEGRTEEVLENYKRWAKERQIVFVMAEDLPRLSEILRKIVAGDRDAEPKHIPYYPRI